MKPISTLFAVFVLFSAQAQEFAPQGATWHYSEGFFYPNPYNEYFMKFEVVGDSVINGINCSKIHKERKMTCNGRNWDEFVYSSNDTVFIYDSILADFHILYDFNSIGGDSWKIPILNFDATGYDTVIVDVDSTDFVTINSVSLKRLHVRYSQKHDGFIEQFANTSIVETLGDLHYLFNFSSYPNAFCDANWSLGLRCYEDSILGFHETGIADSCEYFEIYSNLNEYSVSPFTLSPNPAQDFVQIEMEQGFPEMIYISDAQGRLIIETKDELIDLSAFRSGVYLVRILSEGNWSQSRFVKL